MNSRMFLAAPAALALSAAACTAEMGSEVTGTTEQASTSCSAEYGQCGGTGWTGATCCATGTTCQYSNAYYSQCLPPTSGSSGSSSSSSSSCPSGSNATVQQAAATAAYSVIRAATDYCATVNLGETGSYGAPCWASGILNSQRYCASSNGTSSSPTCSTSGTTIIFNPSDPLYQYVPSAAKAALAVAQLNSSVASFLLAGLQWDQANTNGMAAAVSLPIEALSSFTYPGNASSPIEVYDGNAGGLGRRLETVTGSAWCGSEDVHFADTSSNEEGFAPFNIISVTNMSEGGYWPNYKGSNAWPSTPFNGSGGDSNPYLVIAESVNGSSTALNWNSTSWPTENCTTAACVGTLDIDPIPYTQPAPYYNANGLVGPEANPFTLVLTNIYADPSNEGDWATQVVSGVTHGGTFVTATTYFGVTVYGYVQQY
ncbi:MAG TPA: hypothetical protein VEK07_04090 [Polyangiaceae bacterium]|nr:hypothetical protein [Polyangiaceae bacterium]